MLHSMRECIRKKTRALHANLFSALSVTDMPLRSCARLLHWLADMNIQCIKALTYAVKCAETLAHSRGGGTAPGPAELELWRTFDWVREGGA